jgi:predicted lysophospholipase L1 biosynthesis ABC-type transport system permease subunit
MTPATSQSCFPLRQAFLFALQGIRLRLGRMLLVLLGVTVAIAFTSVLLTTNALFDALPQGVAGAGLTRIPLFRWLWVAVALLICTAGVLNAIVMSVTERIKEIGTLKCLGARSVHVVQIFLFESLLLGLLGGVLGGGAGYVTAIVSFRLTVGGAYLTAAMLAEAARFIPVVIGISAGLSLVASIVPVVIAARVEPASAMRYEV